MTLALVSGGGGFVGRFIVEKLLDEGMSVRITGRTPPVDEFFSRSVEFVPQALDPESDFSAAFAGVDTFVHAAFDHLPGKYRGGEGGDAEGFRRRNHLGTVAFFRAAEAAGVRRAVFLSSRAVYGAQKPGVVLTEQTVPHPDTLYGEVKLAAEREILSMAAAGFEPTVLRITGVYGPAGKGRRHKWADLFDDWRAGREVAPRAGTEVHGEDVATAVSLVLSATDDVAGEAFNVSDITVDRRELLGMAAEITDVASPLPASADLSALNVMSCEKLRVLGWRPGGPAKLFDFLRSSLAS
ncbi:MAG: NAD(P)-dependent oxidoreductase [Hyphomicrobiales bacterium]|nr:NAD(P)-dependent oxidoreductase [Hyphomicrobiales bacterium]